MKIISSRAPLVCVNNFLAGLNTKLSPSVTAMDVAKQTYNFDFVTGVLREGYGLREWTQNLDLSVLQGKIVNIWIYKYYDAVNLRSDDRLMIACESGLVFMGYLMRDTVTLMPISGISVTANTVAINYRLYSEDVFFLCSPNSNMIVVHGDGVTEVIASSPFIRTMALCNERLFATIGGERDSVWFSDDLDPTNWTVELTQGGFVSFSDERGAVEKVVAFGGYVYVFREYGISRLSVYGRQEDFSLQHLFVSSGKICHDSVAVCGDKIIFLAEDGLFCFDGASTTKILSNLVFEKDNAFASACYHNGKYYLALNLAFDDKPIGCELTPHKNNAMLVVDLTLGEYAVARGFDIARIVTLNSLGAVIAISRDGKLGEVERCGEYFGSPTVKRWSTGKKMILGMDRRKSVRQLLVKSSTDISVTVETENSSKVIAVSGGKKVSQVNVGLSGREIGIVIDSVTAKCSVEAIGLKLS